MNFSRLIVIVMVSPVFVTAVFRSFERILRGSLIFL